MKIDGLEWMDWLHKRRAEAERQRRCEGISEEEWLRRVRVRADTVLAEIEERVHPPAVRDRPRKSGK